jgi:hypothetical protein
VKFKEDQHFHVAKCVRKIQKKVYKYLESLKVRLANVTNNIRPEMALIAVMFCLRTSLSECPGNPKNRAIEFDERHSCPSN